MADTTCGLAVPNAAAAHLFATGQALEDYEGLCGNLADEIIEPDDLMLYVEGDIPWSFHMVVLRDGLVHDAWCDSPDALPVREWLVMMFGTTAWVTVAVNGDDVFEGPCSEWLNEYIEEWKASQQ